MTGGAELHKSSRLKKDSVLGMDADVDPVNTGADVNSGAPAACSSNGSGEEEEEAREARESGGSSSKHSGEGGALCAGREQEVSVEIGETYLCQRADKTWRE